MKQRRYLVPLFYCVTVIILLLPSILFGQSDKNLKLGNPSNAKADTTMHDNYLMEKPQYCLSYNNTKHIPNWVSWHVDSTDLGKKDRQNDFRADNSLPATWYHVVTPKDYKNSGFDKGHQCPSGDRTNSVVNNSATFLMTNMIPQAPKNNQQTWKGLEDYSRSLVKQGNELYIICGICGQGGIGSKNKTDMVIGSGVVVPAQTWKIIVVVPVKNPQIDTSTRIITVLMPNTQDCAKQPWYNYRTSIDSLEQLTGYNFLSNIPIDIQKTLEAKIDTLPIKNKTIINQ
ncbi:DNA/RNA non-specific endonuclease [Paludibacter sp.]|uniref:DNA/RNA non-specific endonuclease n=1 Tax=Paludibacter sp. TaxID=1898105 RepID=UPI001355991D|nr:DNA/RNA non-specific endonuclease [Paludibacter sp.]MTK52211.1 DNA/RNA non-specific endonuclease [Paludibacter sp.]